jgi:hypothetical protein
MEWAGGQFLRRIGLSSRGGSATPLKPVVLSGSAADEKSGLVVSLNSTTKFDKAGNQQETSIRYWRHLPFGQSLDQNLVRVAFRPGAKRNTPAQLDEVWVQSRLIFSAARGDNPEEPEMKKNIQRVLEVVNRLNSMLREGGPVQDTAKIFDECHLRQVAGEEIVIRGLDVKGGFAHRFLRPEFMQAAGGASKPMEFRVADRDALKTALGFRINTLEPDKHFNSSRETETADPQSGVLHAARVTVKETPKSLEMVMDTRPLDPPEGTAPLPIPNLAKVVFEKSDSDSYILKDAMFMDRKIDPADTKGIMSLMGFIQNCNSDFAQWKFPSFMNHIMKHDLHGRVGALPAARPLKEGGEMTYCSLHGCGSEKKIENFGDQIGIAAVFSHRGTKEDGSLSTVSVAIDFPYASGGPDSAFDGAVPNYLPFLKDISHIFITHPHFDHKGGLAPYAEKGLLRDKTIVCTARVRERIKQDLNSYNVPRRMRPKFHVIEGDGAMPIRDEEGNIRMWVQYCANATQHSALTTPYIVTGCYNDQHYNGAAIVYGDSSGLTKRAEEFYADIRGHLVKSAERAGHVISAEKLPFKPVVFHDVTSVRFDGRAPTKQIFTDRVSSLFGMFPEHGKVVVPISTNDAEYTAVFDVAHNKKMDITAVGANAEFALRLMNKHGVLPEDELSGIRIDPFEEWQKPEDDRLIPGPILEAYMSSLSYAEALCGSKKESCDIDEMKKIHKREFAKRVKDLSQEQPEHIKNTDSYMLRRLQRFGAVTFDNNNNGYLMHKAIMDRLPRASQQAGRTSATARDMRTEPSSHLIFVTGTQGTAEEMFSTIQKTIDSFSLLDTDERVRPTGYKIDPKKYIFVFTQSAIVGNDAQQEDMVRKLTTKRNVTAVVAHLNGFRVYNPGPHRERLLSEMTREGMKFRVEADGNITVSDFPIHIPGHGYLQDMLDMARRIPAELHIPHHIPDQDSHDIFIREMDKIGAARPKEKSDDFKFYEINGHGKTNDEKFRYIGSFDPSYILIRTLRRYGFAYGGEHEWQETTLKRREGNNWTDALMAHSDGRDDVFRKITAQVNFNDMANIDRRNSERHRQISPSIADRNEGEPIPPRSRPAWSLPVPEGAS